MFRCFVTGASNKIIARRLDITEATVKVHIKAILRKLRVMNRTQAAIWAVTRGLHQDEPVATASIHNPADQPRPQIGRAHVCTPVTNAPLVCRLLLAKKKYYAQDHYI